jgi:hypothetical protein
MSRAELIEMLKRRPKFSEVLVAIGCVVAYFIAPFACFGYLAVRPLEKVRWNIVLIAITACLLVAAIYHQEIYVHFNDEIPGGSLAAVLRTIVHGLMVQWIAGIMIGFAVYASRNHPTLNKIGLSAGFFILGIAVSWPSSLLSSLSTKSQAITVIVEAFTHKNGDQLCAADKRVCEIFEGMITGIRDL